MQNYDQTLVKLISRQWAKANGSIRWNAETPIDRIKSLRKIYEFHDDMTVKSSSPFRRQKSSSTLFCESLEVLQSIHKASTEFVWAAWARSIRAHFRSWPKKEQCFDPDTSTTSTASTFSDVDPITPRSIEFRRKFTPRGADPAYLRMQVEVLCAALEKETQFDGKTDKIERAGNS